MSGELLVLKLLFCCLVLKLFGEKFSIFLKNIYPKNILILCFSRKFRTLLSVPFLDLVLKCFRLASSSVHIEENRFGLDVCRYVNMVYDLYLQNDKLISFFTLVAGTSF